jgi:hypothetical protein
LPDTPIQSVLLNMVGRLRRESGVEGLIRDREATKSFVAGSSSSRKVRTSWLDRYQPSLRRPVSANEAVEMRRAVGAGRRLRRRQSGEPIRTDTQLQVSHMHSVTILSCCFIPDSVGVTRRRSVRPRLPGQFHAGNGERAHDLGNERIEGADRGKRWVWLARRSL